MPKMKRKATRKAINPNKKKISTKPAAKNVKKFLMENEYAVRAIVDKKISKHGKVYYKVSWMGYDKSNDSWEVEDNVRINCNHLIAKYEKEKGNVECSSSAE